MPVGSPLPLIPEARKRLAYPDPPAQPASSTSEADFPLVITRENVTDRLLAAAGQQAEDAILRQFLDTVAVDEALTFLKDAAARRLMINGHEALRLAQALIRLAILAERPDGRGLGLLAEGDALRYLGRYQEALRCYEQARTLFAEQGDEIGWARTYLGWVLAAHYLGNGATAITMVGAAREVLVRNQVWLRVAGLDLNTAIVCYGLGHYDQALQLYDQAQQVYESLGPPAAVRVAWTKADKAMVLTLRGAFQAALTLLREARQTIVEHGETANILRLDQYIADAYAGSGRYTQAVRLYGEVHTAFVAAGLSLDAAQVALSMVGCYLSLNLPDEALRLAEEAAARYAELGTPTETARAQLGVALALARRGDRATAIELLDQVSGQFAAVGLLGEVGRIALQRANLHLAAQQWQAALTEGTTAATHFRKQGLVVGQMQAELVQARAFVGLGAFASAGTLADQVLAAVAERQVPWLAHESHHIRAQLAQLAGNTVEAGAEYQAAIASIERLQAPIASELRANFLHDKLQVYHDAIAAALAAPVPDIDRAFDYLERAKSRALVDYLAAHPDVRLHVRNTTDAPLLQELGRLRGEHNGLYNRLYGYRPGPARHTGEIHDDTTLSSDEMAAIQVAITEREQQIVRLQERLSAQRVMGLEELVPLPIEQFLPRPQLDHHTVLVEYYFGDDSLAFVLTAAGLTVVPLTVPLSAIHRLLQRWKLNLEVSTRHVAQGQPLDRLADNARSILQELYRLLIQPVAPHLAGYTQLVVVPYGATHQIPFHALHDGQQFLIEQMEVTVCPSSTLLRLCTSWPRPPEQRALVMAYSDEGRLPFVLDEAKAVTALIPGTYYHEEAATRAVLQAEIAQYSILHLAAHGEARPDNPAFAYLKLADGQLRAADVLTLPLDGALVILSGCETGRGVVLGGDELIGLARGFLFAGAATLVQSLWRVEDQSTARLMQHFYRALRDRKTKGAALREAQLALLAEGGSHPYHWAPFQLLGDSGRLAS